MLTNTARDFNNALVNAEMNICWGSTVNSKFMLTNEPYCKVVPGFPISFMKKCILTLFKVKSLTNNPGPSF